MYGVLATLPLQWDGQRLASDISQTTEFSRKSSPYPREKERNPDRDISRSKMNEKYGFQMIDDVMAKRNEKLGVSC
jgi:hypothetical protein